MKTSSTFQAVAFFVIAMGFLAIAGAAIQSAGDRLQFYVDAHRGVPVGHVTVTQIR